MLSVVDKFIFSTLSLILLANKQFINLYNTGMFNDFLEEIRNKNQAAKKKLLIGMSVVAMIIVIGGWVYYMNIFVFSTPTETTTNEIKTDFWGVIKTGISVTAQSIGSSIKNISSKLPNLNTENKITIENPK